MVRRDRALIIQRLDRRDPLETRPSGGINEREDLALEIGMLTPLGRARAGIDEIEVDLTGKGVGLSVSKQSMTRVA